MRHFVLLYENSQDKKYHFPVSPQHDFMSLVPHYSGIYYQSCPVFAFVFLPLTPAPLLTYTYLPFQELGFVLQLFVLLAHSMCPVHTC